MAVPRNSADNLFCFSHLFLPHCTVSGNLLLMIQESSLEELIVPFLCMAQRKRKCLFPLKGWLSCLKAHGKAGWQEQVTAIIRRSLHPNPVLQLCPDRSFPGPGGLCLPHVPVLLLPQGLCFSLLFNYCVTWLCSHSLRAVKYFICWLLHLK